MYLAKSDVFHCFLCLVISIGIVAHGSSSILEIDSEELIAGSEIIAIGDVVDVQIQGDPDELRESITIAVDQTLKGTPAATVVLISDYMELGRYEASFATGERVIVFLTRLDGELRTVGGVQGKIMLAAGQVRPAFVSVLDFVRGLRGGA